MQCDCIVLITVKKADERPKAELEIDDPPSPPPRHRKRCLEERHELDDDEDDDDDDTRYVKASFRLYWTVSTLTADGI
jgi:hypothetical protein